MNISKARKLFKEFVITWNDAVQKIDNIYFCEYYGDLPDSLLPADKDVLLKAFQCLIENNNRDELLVKEYYKAIKYLKVFVPVKKDYLDLDKT